jgi:NADH:ubiquinone oxidoreductase subunit 4 (subunit M)
VVVALYLQPEEVSPESGSRLPQVSLAGGITLAVLAGLLLLLGVVPDPMLRLIGASCAGVF